MLKLRAFTILVFALAPFLAMSALAPAHAQSARAPHQAHAAVTTQVHGTFKNVGGRSSAAPSSSGTFSGTFTTFTFYVQHNQLWAKGTLAGTLSGDQKSKNVSNTITFQITKMVQGAHAAALAVRPQSESTAFNVAQQAATTCNVLTLTTGPIHLNLLGLVIDLSPITLTITGQTGPGNLLGNLVCGIAGLLNGLNLSALTQQILGDIAMILNQLLAKL